MVYLDFGLIYMATQYVKYKEGLVTTDELDPL